MYRHIASIKSSFIAAFALIACSAGETSNAEQPVVAREDVPVQRLSIIPQPQSMTPQTGSFRMDEETILRAGDEEKAAAQHLQDMIYAGAGIRLGIHGKNAEGGVVFNIDRKRIEHFGEEGYALTVSNDEIFISAANEAGLFYGVQTLRQMLPAAFERGDGSANLHFAIPAVAIEDQPRFGWRALMLDEARYFMGKEAVFKILDQMAQLKLNVFHWHLTDDHGWRIEIKKYPKLTEIGAFRKDTQFGTPETRQTTRFRGEPHGGFYTQEEIKEILAYAAARHITIVPEIAMPGHASAAIASYPWLGTISKDVEVATKFGVQDPVFNIADPRVIEFLEDVLDETIALFPSDVIHIGGDEVRYDEWNESAEIKELMDREGIATPAALQVHFTNQMSQYVEGKDRRIMGWNEILGLQIHHWQEESDQITESESNLAQSAVVHFWKGDPEMMITAAERGHDIVNSTHQYTYLDYTYEQIGLKLAYDFNPVPEGISEEHAGRILGLGAQMWPEYTHDEQTMERQIYPRIAAYAEVGWTELENKDYSEFRDRILDLALRWEAKDIQYGPFID